MEPFLLGAAWYPEWEPLGEWEKDLARMKEAGLNAVRIAEFSWEAMWPQPDHFDFGLYDRVMKRCEDEGMAVVFGIDTVRPPSWLFELEPDMRLIDNQGHPAPGIWPTLCFNHPRFTHYSERFIREVVNRYKRSPALKFYQLDNEPAYHNRGEVRRDPLPLLLLLPQLPADLQRPTDSEVSRASRGSTSASNTVSRPGNHGRATVD